MKQFLLLALGIAFFGYVSGQEDALVVKEATKINRQLIPPPVFDSLQKFFPRSLVIEYYTMPPHVAKNTWAIADVDTLVSYRDTTDYYLLVVKRGDLKFYSVFSATGQLIMTKKREDATILPAVVLHSMEGIRRDYPGYKVRSTACYTNESQSKQRYYEVVAERGANQQRFFYDAGGTLVKIDVIRRNND